MVTTTISSDVVERNIQLTGDFTRYLLQNPKILNTLPDNFELVILPDNDPELQEYSLELLNQRQMVIEQPIVIVWMRAAQNGQSASLPKFQFYVPIEPLGLVSNGM